VADVRQRNDYKLPDACFFNHRGSNVFQMKSEILILHDSSAILSQKRLSVVAEQGYTMLNGKAATPGFPGIQPMPQHRGIK
jgi:hypothetical protein